MIPQIILLGLMCLGLGIYLAKYGEPRDYYYYNFVLATIVAMIVAFIYLLLLWLGGFFDCFL